MRTAREKSKILCPNRVNQPGLEAKMVLFCVWGCLYKKLLYSCLRRSKEARRGSARMSRRLPHTYNSCGHNLQTSSRNPPDAAISDRLALPVWGVVCLLVPLWSRQAHEQTACDAASSAATSMQNKLVSPFLGHVRLVWTPSRDM